MDYSTEPRRPLDNITPLKKATKDDFLRLLLDEDDASTEQRPAKRQKFLEAKSLDLPKLPNLKQNGSKRVLPPTLSGLHEPPPDAGLLPSMSIEQPLIAHALIKASSIEASNPRGRLSKADRQPKSSSNDATPIEKSAQRPKRKHRKWSEQETNDLLKGVARFGIGNWTKIVERSDYTFHDRSALDLKDRFRVCCPKNHKQINPRATPVQSDVAKYRGSTEAQLLSRPRSRSSKKASIETSAQLERLGIDEPFMKSSRRQRTKWSDEEDEALLLGFKQHGTSWAAIRKGYAALKARKTTDLRDRLRTKYPDEYAKAGLAPRVDSSIKKAETGPEASGADQAPKKCGGSSISAKPYEKGSTQNNTTLPKKKPPTSVLHMDDVFWGAPFEPDNTDTEPITLDRGILDWAYELTRPTANNAPAPRITSIDPLATLNLPEPTATRMLHATPSTQLASASNALPSLAAITATTEVDIWTEPLELPSLIGPEGDVRTAGQLMSLDELLS